MKPSHQVWKSKLAQLALMLNKAIDNGNYDLPIESVRKAAESKKAFEFIRENLATHRLLDLSLFTFEDVVAVNEWFYQSNGNCDIHIKNQGLCLLLVWTIDMMQNAGDPDDCEMNS